MLDLQDVDFADPEEPPQDAGEHAAMCDGSRDIIVVGDDACAPCAVCASEWQGLKPATEVLLPWHKPEMPLRLATSPAGSREGKGSS